MDSDAKPGPQGEGVAMDGQGQTPGGKPASAAGAGGAPASTPVAEPLGGGPVPPVLRPPPLVPPAGPPPSARPVSAPGRGPGGGGWKWILLGVVVVVAVVVLAGIWWAWNEVTSLGSGRVEATEPSRLIEVTVEDNRAGAKLVVVDVEGLITGGYFAARDMNLVEAIRRQLKRAARDGAVKAVILRIDSPGGEVLASDEIARLVREFQEKHGKPVVAAMAGLAASGGYYVAAPCRWIVAHELTLTGSIGVIMHGYNYRGLMNKVGVRPEVYKSGKFKNMLSGDRTDEEILPEERRMLQGLIDETFARFKKVVVDGRIRAAKENDGQGRALADRWEEYADGRVLTGKQAHELGLVDELGDFSVAVDRAKALANVKRANVVRYQEPFDLGSLFRLFGKAEPPTLKVDLGVSLPPLQAGRPYYLFLPGAN